jgi:hypothetical protein
MLSPQNAITNTSQAFFHTKTGDLEHMPVITDYMLRLAKVGLSPYEGSR